MTYAKLPTFKRGETFDWVFVWTRKVMDENGRPVLRADGTEVTQPVDLTGWTLTQEVVSGNFRQALTVTVLDAVAGRYRAFAAASATQNWPLATDQQPLLTDTKRTQGTLVDRSPTFQIPIEDGPTQ